MKNTDKSISTNDDLFVTAKQTSETIQSKKHYSPPFLDTLVLKDTLAAIPGTQPDGTLNTPES